MSCDQCKNWTLYIKFCGIYKSVYLNLMKKCDFSYICNPCLLTHLPTCTQSDIRNYSSISGKLK